jgi:hypothetical protein
MKHFKERKRKQAEQISSTYFSVVKGNEYYSLLVVKGGSVSFVQNK